MSIRQPVVAGRFYPADSEALRQEVADYLAKAGEYRVECADKPALGCMAPHAGYMFSGMVAGLTLGQVPIPETVLLLAPSHTGAGPSLALWPGGAWRTPLGDVTVDEAGVERLLAYAENGHTALFQASEAAHAGDHAIEVILPFLQVLRSDVKIIPLCVREYDLTRLRHAGEAIARLVKERQSGGGMLLLSSSDMSHYLPHDQGKKQDLLALAQVQKLAPEGLFDVCLRHKISMCGFAPTTLMLYACKALGAERCCITAHTSSGVTGRAYGAGMDSVVGYAGAIIN